MTDIPEKALSIRQPWAWAVIHAGKDIENRTAPAMRHIAPRLGDMPTRLAIHASKGMTRKEYDDTRRFMRDIGVTCPAAIDLVRGAVIVHVKVMDVVTDWDSPWYFGPRGLLLRDPVAIEPIPTVGQLGVYDWTARPAPDFPEPQNWMQPRAAKEPRDDRQGRLW